MEGETKIGPACSEAVIGLMIIQDQPSPAPSAGTDSPSSRAAGFERPRVQAVVVTEVIMALQEARLEEAEDLLWELLGVMNAREAMLEFIQAADAPPEIGARWLW